MPWLKENPQIKENPELALKNLEKKSKKNLEENSLVYETWENKENNIIYSEMTKTPEIEAKSISFITNLMNETLKNSKNPKIQKLLKFTKEKIA